MHLHFQSHRRMRVKLLADPLRLLTACALRVPRTVPMFTTSFSRSPLSPAPDVLFHPAQTFQPKSRCSDAFINQPVCSGSVPWVSRSSPHTLPTAEPRDLFQLAVSFPCSISVGVRFCVPTRRSFLVRAYLCAIAVARLLPFQSSDRCFRQLHPQRSLHRHFNILISLILAVPLFPLPSVPVVPRCCGRVGVCCNRCKGAL